MTDSTPRASGDDPDPLTYQGRKFRCSPRKRG